MYLDDNNRQELHTLQVGGERGVCGGGRSRGNINLKRSLVTQQPLVRLTACSLPFSLLLSSCSLTVPSGERQETSGAIYSHG